MPGLSMINRCAFIALLSVATATAADVQTAVGEVDSVQLVDATSLGGETFLTLFPYTTLFPSRSTTVV